MGRKASCCALLKRCTSSTKRIVRRCSSSRHAIASSTTERSSFTPDNTAEMLTKCAFVSWAMSRARVVCPNQADPKRSWRRVDPVLKRCVGASRDLRVASDQQIHSAGGPHPIRQWRIVRGHGNATSSPVAHGPA